jgi:TolB-like protein
LAGIGLAIGALLVFTRTHFLDTGAAARPRLSIVVLPFENLSGDPHDDYLADGITDDLTSDLAHLSVAFVIARQSAYTYKGKPKDVRRIGEELGVRYVLEGSVRRIGATLRINVQLTSGETGAHLWSDRFDEDVSELAAGQEQIVTRMRSELGVSMIDIENARSLREHSTNPDAFDFILRARAIANLPPNPQHYQEALILYERALALDPSSIQALVGVASSLMERFQDGTATFDELQRTEQLLTQAQAIAPNSGLVLNYLVQFWRLTGRCEEVIEAAQKAIEMDPNHTTGVYNELGICKTQTGHAEEEIPLQATANRRNPRSSFTFRRFNRMGFASLMLGRDQDAIRFLLRSTALNPVGGGQHVYRELAAAYARIGQLEEAKHALAEADRMWAYDTVRGHWPAWSSSPVYAAQVKDYQDALRLAGERNHADEDADFAVAVDRDLHRVLAGPTPTSAPGATTIRTQDLARLLSERQPILIDTVSNFWGQSLPGAVGLKFAGLGGTFADTAQARLRSKVGALSVGDLDRPIVAVGWNSERFDGRNLALRLVALGYTHVYWYRGGREAWEVNELPETELKVEAW